MNAEMVEATVDGVPRRVREGTSVAATILGLSEIGPAAWAPLCGMGVCWGCRVTIDGHPDRRACLVLVTSGMKVETTS